MYEDQLTARFCKAAIIAQIAITMPGLANFGSIHWTATAFAYTSLVCGLLSTFFSFYVQQILNNLQSAEAVHGWFTQPRNNFTTRLLNSVFGQHKPGTNDADRIPSLTAAAILTAPSRLLFLSVMSLFVALGIYLGSIYTAKLGELKGSNANLAVLLFFIIFSAWSLSEISIPLLSKELDQIAIERDDEARNFPLAVLSSRRRGTEPTIILALDEPTGTGDVIREALRASIQAQEESLRAQKALLELYDTRSSEV
jgi:hypothetical protein